MFKPGLIQVTGTPATPPCSCLPLRFCSIWNPLTFDDTKPLFLLHGQISDKTAPAALSPPPLYPGPGIWGTYCLWEHPHTHKLQNPEDKENVTNKSKRREGSLSLFSFPFRPSPSGFWSFSCYYFFFCTYSPFLCVYVTKTQIHNTHKANPGLHSEPTVIFFIRWSFSYPEAWKISVLYLRWEIRLHEKSSGLYHSGLASLQDSEKTPEMEIKWLLRPFILNFPFPALWFNKRLVYGVYMWVCVSWLENTHKILVVHSLFLGGNRSVCLFPEVWRSSSGSLSSSLLPACLGYIFPPFVDNWGDTD